MREVSRTVGSTLEIEGWNEGEEGALLAFLLRPWPPREFHSNIYTLLIVYGASLPAERKYPPLFGVIEVGGVAASTAVWITTLLLENLLRMTNFLSLY